MQTYYDLEAEFVTCDWKLTVMPLCPKHVMKTDEKTMESMPGRRTAWNVICQYS